MPVIVRSVVTREQKIDFILLHRHGAGSEHHPLMAGLEDEAGQLSSEPSAIILAAQGTLEALPDDQLDAQYQEARASAAARLAEHLAKKEAARPFNQPGAKADYSHWAKCTHWEIYEAIALVLGKEPEVVNWDSIRPYADVSSFVQTFDRLADLAFRAVAADQLTQPIRPGAFIVWAKQHDIAIPVELESTVENCELKMRFEALQAEAETAKSVQSDDLQPIKGPDLREIESLRKLVIGMAVRGYGFDPRAKRSESIADIVEDLDFVGIPLDRDTVRKHLKEAAALLPSNALVKARK